MLLGLVVNDKGLIPDADIHQIETLGKEIVRQYGIPLQQTSGTGSEYILSFDKPTSNNGDGECRLYVPDDWDF